MGTIIPLRAVPGRPVASEHGGAEPGDTVALPAGGRAHRARGDGDPGRARRRLLAAGLVASRGRRPGRDRSAAGGVDDRPAAGARVPLRAAGTVEPRRPRLQPLRSAPQGHPHPARPPAPRSDGPGVSRLSRAGTTLHGMVVRLLTTMSARDPGEEHRVSTPLELFFDLTFVVAVAQASSTMHHLLVDGHARDALLVFPMVFFAIWWAWMGFTWFASAYDPDDAAYRVMVFVQMAGVLVFAAGVARFLADLGA